MAHLTRAVHRNPDTVAPHAYLAAMYTSQGRHEAAQHEIAEIRRVSPKFSLDVARQRSLYQDETVRERYLNLLSQAGLS